MNGSANTLPLFFGDARAASGHVNMSRRDVHTLCMASGVV
jgi:hypothetical protein